MVRAAFLRPLGDPRRAERGTGLVIPTRGDPRVEHTNLKNRTNGERRRHDATLSRIAQKAALLNRKLR